MKAKEWKIRFEKPEDLANNLMDYVDETADLIRFRGNSDTAIEGVFREQFQKWDSICKTLDYLDRSILEEIYQERIPAMFAIYDRVFTQTWHGKRVQNIRKDIKQRMTVAELIPDPQLRGVTILGLILERQDRLKQEQELVK